MKKILAIAIVAVMTLALCVGVNAASLKNHSFDTIYVNDLETPVINNGQAKAWSEENPIDEEITALRVRGWAHVEESTIASFGYKVDEGTPVFNTAFIFDRPDVQGAFGVTADIANGFDISLNFEKAGKGEHVITILVKTADDTEIEVTNFTVTQKLEGDGTVSAIVASEEPATDAPAEVVKGEDQWLTGKEVEGAEAPSWWFNPLGDPDDRFITVTFTATSAFSGIKGFYYCSTDPEAASFKIEVIKDGAAVAEKIVKPEGDKWYETDFGKTFEAGEYTLRYTTVSGTNEENTSWFVLGGVAGENDAVAVDANVNAPGPGTLPAIMLIGATGNQGGNPQTSDAAVIAIAAVAVVALAGVVVAKKVR